MIRHKCVKCKQILETSEGKQGEFVKCPACGVSNKVPPPGTGLGKKIKWIVLVVVLVPIIYFVAKAISNA